jgi:hypothetical protein
MAPRRGPRKPHAWTIWQTTKYSGGREKQAPASAASVIAAAVLLWRLVWAAVMLHKCAAAEAVLLWWALLGLCPWSVGLVGSFIRGRKSEAHAAVCWWEPTRRNVNEIPAGTWKNIGNCNFIQLVWNSVMSKVMVATVVLGIVSWIYVNGTTRGRGRGLCYCSS